MFVNGFGVHRNNYRFLKGFYLISANLLYEKRKKIANNFILFLKSHGTFINDIVNAFSSPIQQLNQGVKLKIDGIFSKICAFTIIITGNMP